MRDEGRKKIPNSAGIMVLLALFSYSAGVLPAAAQSGRKPGENVPAPGVGQPAGDSDPDVLTRIRTNEVVLPVTVRNDYGKLSHDLGLRDFVVVEDGVRQEITSFNARRVPLRVALLLDVSGSVFGEMENIRKASAAFVARLAPDDEACVVQFGKSVELLQDWTSDKSKLEHALNWRYRPDREIMTETHLWDAVFLAADEILAKTEGRRVALLLTDCLDNNSKLYDPQALGALLRADASLYVVSKARATAEEVKRDYGGVGGAIAGTRKQANRIAEQLFAAEERMQTLAERTGGKLFSPRNPEDMADAYRDIAEELQSQYVLTYESKNDNPVSGRRKIQVFLNRPGLKASTRDGYYPK